MMPVFTAIFAGKARRYPGMWTAPWLLCVLFLSAGIGPSLRAATAPVASVSAAKQNSTSTQSSDAAYAKYLKERHDVHQFQRKQERKEEIQQKKVDNPEAEDGANTYRHSPMVQTLAHFFGLSTEVMARIFEALNFIILMAAIVWFLARHLPKTLRNREQRIQTELTQARTATEDANRRLAGVEERLARLDEDIAAIKIQAEQETVAEEVRLRSTLEQEKQSILAAAGQEIASASANAQRQLKNMAAELIIEHARRQMAVTAETDRSLLEGFLTDLNENAPRGGVN